MRDPAPAVLAGRYLRTGVLERWPGCQFVMRRDGDLHVDASIGWARAPWDDDGPAAMTGDSIIHIASMSKPITATALFALFDDWNAIRTVLLGPAPQVAGLIPPNLPPAVIYALQNHTVAQ